MFLYCIERIFCFYFWTQKPDCPAVKVAVKGAVRVVVKVAVKGAVRVVVRVVVKVAVKGVKSKWMLTWM